MTNPGTLVLVLGVGLLAAVTLPPTAGAASESTTRVDCGSLASTILGRSVSYCVTLPPGYDSSASSRYPVLYFLHGLFENEQSWIERGGQQTWEDLMSQGQLGKFLVVLPNGGKTFYVNSLNGHERYEDFFIEELVPAIDRTYRTTASPAARGISGTSMGGYGALHLGMRHPEVFGSASAHSAALLPKFPNPLPSEGRWGFYARILQGPFGSPLSEAYWEANNPLTLAEHPERFARLKLYFDCGDHDRYGFEEGAQLLDRILSAKGFPHEFALRPGDHGWSYLNQYMKYSLTFHWRWFEEAEGKLTTSKMKGGTRWSTGTCAWEDVPPTAWRLWARMPTGSRALPMMMLSVNVTLPRGKSPSRLSIRRSKQTRAWAAFLSSQHCS